MKIHVCKGFEQNGSALGKAAEIGNTAVNEAVDGTQSLIVTAQEESQKVLQSLSCNEWW